MRLCANRLLCKSTALASKSPSTRQPVPWRTSQSHTGTCQQARLARTCAPLRRFSTLALRCTSLSFFLTVVSHTKSVPPVLPPSVLAGDHVTCFPPHWSPRRRGSKRAIDAAPVMLNVNSCSTFWSCASGICSGVLVILIVISVVMVPLLRTNCFHTPPSSPPSKEGELTIPDPRGEDAARLTFGAQESSPHAQFIV